MSPKMLFYICLVISYVTGEWVDPHNMNTNAKQRYLNPSLPKKSNSVDIETLNECTNANVYASHLKRIVSRLVYTAHINRGDPDKLDGHIRFQMNADDFQFISGFAKEDITLNHLRKLDRIFSESFQKSLINNYIDTLEWCQMKIYSTLVNVYNLWIIGCVCLIYFVYLLIKNEFSLAYILKYFMSAILICDYCFRYKALLEEAEEHNAKVTYSSLCDTKKMTWTEYTTFLFSSRNCEVQTVTPLDVALYQVKNLIIIPLRALGTGMGGFGREMFTTLPWGLNIIMWPIMLLFVICITMFVMAFITGTSIEFNAFHLFKLKFGGHKPHENRLAGQIFQRLADGFMQRPLTDANPSATVDQSRPAGNRNPQSETTRLPSEIPQRPLIEDVPSAAIHQSTPEDNNSSQDQDHKANDKKDNNANSPSSSQEEKIELKENVKLEMPKEAKGDKNENN